MMKCGRFSVEHDFLLGIFGVFKTTRAFRACFWLYFHPHEALLGWGGMPLFLWRHDFLHQFFGAMDLLLLVVFNIVFVIFIPCVTIS